MKNYVPAVKENVAGAYIIFMPFFFCLPWAGLMERKQRLAADEAERIHKKKA